jgi:Zn-dependent peptidase ImmA (M78 family)
MTSRSGITWTNRSALALAPDGDPVVAIQEAAQRLVLKAREAGWQGPPFNPVKIVEMLGASLSANASISDARLLASSDGPVVEYNPQQPRERVRFSIAHEVAHMLFPDWREDVRNRGGSSLNDDWQLEMLCNIAASEFVLPIGSLPQDFETASIEDLMREKRRYDVSAEAFLIRFVKASNAPVTVFFASPIEDAEGVRNYRVDYAIASPLAPKSNLEGTMLPRDSAARSCTAIGHTDRAVESWFAGGATTIEYVGIPGYPGARYPRVAGVVRHEATEEGKRPIRYVHGDVTRPLGGGSRIVCQLVNDRAIRWGGGVAKRFARLYPDADDAFAAAMMAIPPRERLGQVVFVPVAEDVLIASIIAQEGFGPSLFPRVRYGALRQGLSVVAIRAAGDGASVHMAKIGTGAAGGEWGVVEEIVDAELVAEGVTVTVYEPPPRREQFDLFSG